MFFNAIVSNEKTSIYKQKRVAKGILDRFCVKYLIYINVINHSWCKLFLVTQLISKLICQKYKC